MYMDKFMIFKKIKSTKRLFVFSYIILLYNVVKGWYNFITVTSANKAASLTVTTGAV